MGKGGAVLTVGRPLPWQEAKDKLTYVRQHGVDQFIQHYRRHETKQRDTLLYGDEIEYGLFKLSSDGASLSLRGDEVRSLLSNREAEERRAILESGKVTWHPEYGSWMVESTPEKPYSGYTDDLRRVESSMRSRRARLLMALKENEVAPTVVAFPLLGMSNDELPRNGPVASSVLVPDEVINPHPRFGALTKNIRERRGSNVEVVAPLFQDDATKGDAIKADAMAFGVQTASYICAFVSPRWRRARHNRHQRRHGLLLPPGHVPVPRRRREQARLRPVGGPGADHDGADGGDAHLGRQAPRSRLPVGHRFAKCG